MFLVGNYGNVMKIKTTGASATTARQDGDTGLSGKRASRQLAKTDLQRMNRFKDAILKVGQDTGMDPAVIAAIISRSSRAGSEYVLVDGCSPDGDMFGLMQISKQWHSPKGTWDSEEHVRQGTDILIYSIGIIRNKFPKWTKEQQLKGGLAAYNAGAQNVHQYEAVDDNTSSKDYSNDVVARAKFYRKHGFHL